MPSRSALCSLYEKMLFCIANSCLASSYFIPCSDVQTSCGSFQEQQNYSIIWITPPDSLCNYCYLHGRSAAFRSHRSDTVKAEAGGRYEGYFLIRPSFGRPIHEIKINKQSVSSPTGHSTLGGDTSTLSMLHIDAAVTAKS